MPPKKFETKHLTQQMQNLEAMFESKLQQFKDEMNKLKSTSSKVDGNDDLENLEVRFTTFEDYTKSALNKLNDMLKSLSDKSMAAEKKCNYIEMENNNFALLIHGVEENSDGNKDVLNVVKTIFENNLNISIEKNEIKNCYRLGKLKSDKSKSRPIVVSFVTRWKRDEVFYVKRHLKGKQWLISEKLTKLQYDLFKKCVTLYNKKCWSDHGKIIVFANNKKNIIKSTTDLQKLNKNNSVSIFDISSPSDINN